MKLFGLFITALLSLALMAAVWVFGKTCSTLHGYGKELDRIAFYKSNRRDSHG